MSTIDDSLADRITSTLRGVIEVRLARSHFLLSRPEFWDRCHLVTANWWKSPPSHILVDGFANCCHWNSWKVYADAVENGLSLWLGYAFSGGSWTHHAWCMLGGRVVETTVRFPLYFGAELQSNERQEYCLKYEKYGLEDFKAHGVFTILNGRREPLPYDSDKFANTIGRERDPATFQVKAGLGR